MQEGTNIQVIDEILRFAKDVYLPKKVLEFSLRETCFRLKESMIRKREYLSGAESVTAGSISSKLTDIPGSSAYFKGSIVTYSPESKTQLLGVSELTLERAGIVSIDVAKEMAKNVAGIFKTGFAYSTTGYAGPKGDPEDKVPVGTICVGFVLPNGLQKDWKAFFDGDRDSIRELTTDFVIRCLYIIALNYFQNED